MPSLADVVQQMGPSITYDERTRRFHDMEQNYRMVSTKGVTAGRPTRADGRGSSAYVTQEIFNAFRSEVYLYISKVASFTREALIEMQKSMIGEQRDTETLRNDQRREAEERRERRKELISGALTKVSSGIRQATGMGPLGALFTGISAGLVALLANVDLEKLRETFNNISSVFDKVKEFFDKLKEYSDILIAIGAALATMVAANMLDRTKPRTPKPPSPNRPSPTPGSGSGSGSGAKPSTGTGGAGAGGAAAGAASGAAAAAAGKPTITAPKPQAAIAETDKSGKTRYRDPKTGRFTKPPAPPAPSGAPTSAPPSASGQPTQDRPRGNFAGRAARFLAIPGVSAILESINASEQINQLSEQRDEEAITEEEYKKQVIEVIARALGAIGGGTIGGSIGAALGTIIPGPGNLIGGMLGAYFGANAGARAGEWFVSTGIGQMLADIFYERFFVERSSRQGQLESALTSRLNELRRERAQRILRDEEMVDTTERAVNEGRITRAQANQINEIGSQAGTVRRAGDIEAAIEAISASGLEGANSRLVAGREDRTGRIIVLPTIYQESVRPDARQNQPAPPSQPAGIQTRNSDNTLGDAYNGAGFMTAAF